MNRLFSFALILFVFLDVAVFPFSCRGNPDQNKVYIHFMTEATDDDGNSYYDYAQVSPNEKRFGTFKIDDTITEEDVLAVMENVTPHEEEHTISIVKYLMMGSFPHKDITLPYTITPEDKLPYLRGIRGAAHLIVVVKVEAPEDNPEA
ncbi:MAG: hypothetical protein PHG08_05975 [Bacilli bacterium]|jgi:hypothetical protein|nr:hypothetical protein [Bacilli bacterium]HHU23912.1 hypothetical protein [Acholeplasmataceae bacterium]